MGPAINHRGPQGWYHSQKSQKQTNSEPEWNQYTFLLFTAQEVFKGKLALGRQAIRAESITFYRELDKLDGFPGFRDSSSLQVKY